MPISTQGLWQSQRVNQFMLAWMSSRSMRSGVVMSVGAARNRVAAARKMVVRYCTFD